MSPTRAEASRTRLRTIYLLPAVQPPRPGARVREASPDPFSLRSCYTKRPVTYMIAMPAVSPPRFAPERAGVLARAASFRDRPISLTASTVIPVRSTG